MDQEKAERRSRQVVLGLVFFGLFDLVLAALSFQSGHYLIAVMQAVASALILLVAWVSHRQLHP